MESAKAVLKDQEKVKIRKKFCSITYVEGVKIGRRQKRHHSFDKQKILLLCCRSPVTPVSSLFDRPKESPDYLQLNYLMSKLNAELSLNPTELLDQSTKTIKMNNTACSSLLQRRNKSQRTFRLTFKVSN
jgi:hypothetical protein